MATYVLVHGAYQGGWIWKPVAERLRAAGHRVIAPTLDGCGHRHDQVRPGITVATHGQEIAKLLFYEDLDRVMLVGTSSGGMVICKAAELARERIGRLFFVDALALMSGERVGDIVKRAAPNDTNCDHDGAHAGRRREAPLRRSRSRHARLGAGPLHAAPGRGARGARRARQLLEPDVADHGRPVPPRREPARGAPAPHGRAAQGRLARARHRPLPDAEPAGAADAPAAGPGFLTEASPRCTVPREAR